MSKNLLQKTPECHRQLFNTKESEGRITKTVKTEFTLEDLIEYYAVVYGESAPMPGDHTTQDALDQARATAIKDAPELSVQETERLLEMVEKFGLETVLYAMDLTISDRKYPKMEEIFDAIPDATECLAVMIRMRDYGV